MRKLGAVIVAMLLAAVVAGCSSASGSTAANVEVIAKNMKFDSPTVTVKKGTSIKLVLNNQDVLLHDFTVDKIPVKGVKEGKGDAHEMSNMNTPDLHASADAGKTATVEFTPSEAGKYTYYCTVAGHKEAGMIGQLVVE